MGGQLASPRTKEENDQQRQHHVRPAPHPDDLPQIPREASHIFRGPTPDALQNTAPLQDIPGLRNTAEYWRGVVYLNPSEIEVLESCKKLMGAYTIGFTMAGAFLGFAIPKRGSWRRLIWVTFGTSVGFAFGIIAGGMNSMRRIISTPNSGLADYLRGQYPELKLIQSAKWIETLGVIKIGLERAHAQAVEAQKGSLTPTVNPNTTVTVDDQNNITTRSHNRVPTTPSLPMFPAPPSLIDPKTTTMPALADYVTSSLPKIPTPPLPFGLELASSTPSTPSTPPPPKPVPASSPASWFIPSPPPPEPKLPDHYLAPSSPFTKRHIPAPDEPSPLRYVPTQSPWVYTNENPPPPRDMLPK